jgi:hypothetical protein
VWSVGLVPAATTWPTLVREAPSVLRSASKRALFSADAVAQPRRTVVGLARVRGAEKGFPGQDLQKISSRRATYLFSEVAKSSAFGRHVGGATHCLTPL